MEIEIKGHTERNKCMDSNGQKQLIYLSNDMILYVDVFYKGD